MKCTQIVWYRWITKMKCVANYQTCTSLQLCLSFRRFHPTDGIQWGFSTLSHSAHLGRIGVGGHFPTACERHPPEPPPPKSVKKKKKCRSHIIFWRVLISRSLHVPRSCWAEVLSTAITAACWRKCRKKWNKCNVITWREAVQGFQTAWAVIHVAHMWTHATAFITCEKNITPYVEVMSSGLRQETGSSSAPLRSRMSEITAALQFTSVDCVSVDQGSFWKKNQLLSHRVSSFTWELWGRHGHAGLVHCHIVLKTKLKGFRVEVIDLKGFSTF